MFKKCLVCNKEFKIYFCRKDTAKYCSRECSDKSKKGKIPANIEILIKRLPWNKGKKMDKDYREKLSKSHMGKTSGNKGKKQLSTSGNKNPAKRFEVREKLKKIMLKRSIENSKIGKEKWKDMKYREKTIKAILKGLMKRPTSLEKQMIELIKKHSLPYKYTGDGSFLVGFKNPDFVNINGEKKLIEVGNVYHHQNDYENKRREHFAKYGWKSYIFIGNKFDEAKVLRKLVEET